MIQAEFFSVRLCNKAWSEASAIYNEITTLHTRVQATEIRTDNPNPSKDYGKR